MYSEMMPSYSTYKPDYPNPLISWDDICADCQYWLDMSPSLGPAVLLDKATFHLTRTSSMLRKLSEKLMQDEESLVWQANQLADHKLLLEFHQNALHILERGIVMKWRARILAHLDSQIKALRKFVASLIALQSEVACLSPQIMGPFQSSSDVLGLSYGEYAPVDPHE